MNRPGVSDKAARGSATRLSTTLIALLLTACAQPGALRESIASASPQAVATAGSERELRERISAEVAAAWKGRDFRRLDATADEYLRTRARTYSGKWRLSVWYDALSDQLRIDWPDEWYSRQTPSGCRCKIPDPAHYGDAEPRWKAVHATVEEWMRRSPHSVHAKLALAQLFVNEGWFYRGTGQSDTVQPEAWPIFSRYLKEADDTLTLYRDVRTTDPEWFDIMFIVASAEQWPRQRVDGLLEDLRKNGKGYATAYQSAANHLLPKWGGSYEELEQFARQAMRDAGDDGLELYTRLYWNAVRAERFLDSQADWPTMKRGFELIISRYPDSRNVNGLAMYACGAGDRATFLETMPRLGVDLTPETWSILVNACKARYGWTGG